MADIDKGLPSNTRTKIDVPTEEEIEEVSVKEEEIEKGPVEVTPEEDGGATIDFDTPTLEGVDDVDIEEVKERVLQERLADEASRREERKAGGGIAGIRKPDAIPPESGPNPQGLENLKYYVTNT